MSDRKRISGPRGNAKGLGRRESNKQDKLERIRKAARASFMSNGYDNATTRDIAQRAKVALGTLFSYATDKRDLLFLVINDEFDQIAKDARASINRDASLLQNLLSAFGLLYEFFSKNPVLSRLVLREMLFYEAGTQARRFVATRNQMMRVAREIVEHAQRRGEIKSGQDASTSGSVLFAVFQFEVRQWLSQEKLSIRKGMADLEKAFGVVITGLASKKVP